MGIAIKTNYKRSDINTNLKYYQVDYNGNMMATRTIEFENIAYNKFIPLLFLPELCLTGYQGRDNNNSIISYAIVKLDWS